MEPTTKHENSSVSTKDYDNGLTKHEGDNALMNPKSGTQLFDYRTHWATTADKYTHWKKSIQQTLAKDDNVLHTSWEAFSTKHEDVKNAVMNSKSWKALSTKHQDVKNAVMDSKSWKALSTKHEDVKSALTDSKPWKALSSIDYQTYWTTLADKYTHLERGMKEDNVLNKSWKAFSTTSRWSVIATLLLVITIVISIWNRSPPHFVGDVNYVCESPQVIQPWQIKAFRPNWFGLFGSPGPITYKTKGRKGHRVSIVDIDRRDIEIAIRVDDKTFRHIPVVLDNTVSCGEDLAKCSNMGFGAGVVSVPPGKHTISAEILDVNGTFRWEHERQRRVWYMVEECS